MATPWGERPIEELAPGDMVLARGESDSAVSARPVLKTFVRGTSSLVDVRVEALDGNRESIRSTPEHPYFTLDRGWVHAGGLTVNEPLVDSSGREARVTNVAPLPLEALVYNVEVDIDHTYFVGHSAVWVHNQCTTRGGPSAGPAPSAGSSKSGGGSKKRPAPDDDDDEGNGKGKRPKFWTDTEKKVVDKAEKDANGNPTCPTCGTSIDPNQKIPLTKKDGSPQLKKDGTQKERRPFDIDHTYAPGAQTPDTKNGTWAQRQEEIDKVIEKAKQDGKPLSEKEIKDLKNEAYNSNVRFQCPSCNISHQYEDHTGYKPGVVTSGTKKGGKKK
ncbi:hypothetical protein LZC95_34630 [Pendulispora brunnea]|uniref:Intein C-terminal splicing domain-containing protein n=1 Tax=Pendulispora brunnea TaxID=2905690 RepID=A0ABZ2K2J2_9BACT